MNLVPEFSRVGDPPTAFEYELVRRIEPKLERDVWAIVAATVGADAVARTLDYVADRATRIPTRHAFFTRLWAPHRDAQLRRLMFDEGWNAPTAAKACGCSTDTADRVRDAHRRANNGRGK